LRQRILLFPPLYEKKGYGIDRGEQISVPQLRSPFVSAVFVLLPLFFIFPKVVIFV
jgi:hypothetical protein